MMGDDNHDDGSLEDAEIEVGEEEPVEVEDMEVEEATVEPASPSGGGDDFDGGGGDKKLDAKEILTKAVSETVKAGAKLEVRAWKGGFLGWLGRGIGTTCSRTWIVDHPEYTGTITLEHDCLTGRRVLYIDRVVVYQRTVFPDKSFEIWFDIDGKSGRVCAENDFKGNALYYSCMYADEALVTTLAERDQESTHFRPSIPDTVVEVDGKLEVAFYNVTVQTDAGEFKLKKRFSEFVDLYEKVWASYSSDELLQQVPKPPKKQFKLFTKHHDAKFVENRRVQLQSFVQGLCKVPAIERNLYLLDFLGQKPPEKRGEGKVTMMETCESKFKFTVNASGATLFKKLADWEDVSWKGAESCEVTETEEGKMRRFQISEPWGDVVELLVVCEENQEGGGVLEYQMQQSEIPLRFFECSIEVQERKKEVQARGMVTLKFVPGPGEDAKKLTRIIEESFKSHLHALEESFLS